MLAQPVLYGCHIGEMAEFAVETFGDDVAECLADEPQGHDARPGGMVGNLCVCGCGGLAFGYS